MSEAASDYVQFSGTTRINRKCRCDQGLITILYVLKTDGTTPKISYDNFKSPTLTKFFGTIKIEVKPREVTESPFSLTLSVAEMEDLVGGDMPTTETYEAFCRKVRERKAYPPAKVPIPGGGEKSLTAQGQTKKPGSHSTDRHK